MKVDQNPAKVLTFILPIVKTIDDQLNEMNEEQLAKCAQKWTNRKLGEARRTPSYRRNQTYPKGRTEEDYMPKTVQDVRDFARKHLQRLEKERNLPVQTKKRYNAARLKAYHAKRHEGAVTSADQDKDAYAALP